MKQPHKAGGGVRCRPSNAGNEWTKGKRNCP